MEYFWMYSEKVNELGLDIGFELFSAGHIIWLIAIAIGIDLMCRHYVRLDDAGRDRVRKRFAWGFPIAEIIKDIVLYFSGANLLHFLPLHLCGLGLICALIDYYLPNNKLFGQMFAYAFGPGAVAALLFCNWSALPILLCFQSIFSFLIHGAIVCFVLMRLLSGEIVPTYKGLWKTALALIIIAVPVYLVDMLLGQNYMFIYKVQENSPLVMIWSIFGTRFGQAGYLAGYALLALIVFHVLYLVYGLLGFRNPDRRIKAKH